MNQYPNMPPMSDGGKFWTSQPQPPGPFSCSAPKQVPFQQTTPILSSGHTFPPNEALDFMIRNNNSDFNGQNSQSIPNDLSTTTRQPFSKPGSMLPAWKNLQLPTMPTASVFYGGTPPTNNGSNNDHRNSTLLAEDIQRMIGAMSSQLPMTNDGTTVSSHKNIIPTFMNPLTVQHFSPKITNGSSNDLSNGKTNGHSNGQESGDETAKNLALLTEFCSKSTSNEVDGGNNDAVKHNGNDLEVAKAMLSMREFSPRAAIPSSSNEASSSSIVRCPSNTSAVSEPTKTDLMNGSVSSLLSAVHIQSISPDNKGVVQDNGASISNLISTMSPYINPAIFMTKDQATSSMLIKTEQHQEQNGVAQNQPTIYKCQICKFSSSSKFHFNSHMNTHTDHKCTYCDYTSRTIGRLKRHMNDFHTHDKKDEENNPPPGSEKPPTTTSSSSSSSKPKTFRCKTCSVVVQSKDDLWTHQRSHIKSERILSCPKCTFVTEYKHHLEYHLRNHFGSKPFKCHKCNYTCVNKSMLNSHLKSHSNFYPYRCVNCRYTTKYCHSLKLHLQKYNHTSVTHLPDESPEGELEAARLEEAAGIKEESLMEEASSTCAEGMDMTATTSTFPTMMNELLFFKSNHSNGNGFGFSPIVTSVLQQKFSTPVPFGAQLPTIATTNVEQHQCHICHSIFDTKEVLAAHMYKHIVESNEGVSTTAEHKTNGHDTSSPILRCQFCYQSDFDNKESLANHLVKHLVENMGLFGMYGLASGRGSFMESLAAAAAVSTSSLPLHHYRQQQDQFLAENSTSSRSRSISNNTEEEMMMMASGNVATSMNAVDDGRQSPASSSMNHNEEKNSASSETGGSEPGLVVASNGSTKRRKGKAFKLDQISQRLQRCSSVSPDFMANDYKFSNGKRLETFDTSNDPSPSSTLKSDPTDLRLHSYRFDGGGNDYEEDNGADHDNDDYTASAVIHGNGDASKSFPTMTKETQRNQMGKAAAAVDVATSNDKPTTSMSTTVTPAAVSSFCDWSKAFVCKFCDMAFADSVMHAIHMGYHGYDDPFKCNMCGTITSDKLSMFLHVTQAPHI